MIAVILDLDNTLIVSKIDFAEMKRRIVAYLSSKGVPPHVANPNRSTHDITSTAAEYLRESKRDAEIRPIFEAIDHIMTEIELSTVNDATAIKGAKEALTRLRSRGAKIGILTRSCRSYATQVLTFTGLGQYVDQIAARDDCGNPKPDPSQLFALVDDLGARASETIMVGDHPIDALCAKNAGVRFIGVLTGSWTRDATEQLGPMILPSIADLPELLDRLVF